MTSQTHFRFGSRNKACLLRADVVHACCWTFCLFCLFAGIQCATAETNSLGLEVGLHYYAISNLDNRDAPVLRGKAGSQGYAHDAIILAPNTRYREWILQIRTMHVASEDFTTPSAGQRFQLPRFLLQPVSSSDSDGDGLHNLAEFILGTNPNKADSDGDGVQDGVEIQDGTDPLDGLPATIGIIAATDTSGTAVDVCALNDLAIVANREAGVSVLNVSGQNPIRIAEVDTPGTALRVACFGNLIAVADGPSGLAIIDITDPPGATNRHQINFGSSAEAVTAAGGIAYVGLASGDIVAVDLASGALLDQLRLGGFVLDITIAGDTLYAFAGRTLYALPLDELGLRVVGSASSPGSGLRLVVGGGIAYVTHSRGYNTFDVANPAQPILIAASNTGQSGWQQIVPNGSGIGIAAVGLTEPNDVSLYDTSDPLQTDRFLTEIATPGIAYAVSIYNGRAYVADGQTGLQVVNYLAYDSGTNPPSITLSPSFTLNTPTNGVAEEGKLARVTASVTDDVQVRNVEFYVDGARVLTDGNFPFEHRFLTPRLTTSKTNFTVRAKATDTGGNFRWSDEILVTLSLDATPPRLWRTDPATNSFVSVTNPPLAVFAYFNEPMDVSSLGLGNYRLIFAGPDNFLGTADDVNVTNAVVSYRDTLNAGVLEFPSPLGLGLYQCVITTNVTDAAGNNLASEFHWTFAILAGGASDDDDGDGLSNADEMARGTNPFSTDTDGDGWSDLDEVENTTDPASTTSRPQQTFLAYPSVQVFLPSPDMAGTAGAQVFVAQPPVQIDLPSPDTFGLSGVGIILARPPVEIELPSPDVAGTNSPGLFLAKPPVSIVITNQ
jgi:hypothetical protein